MKGKNVSGDKEFVLRTENETFRISDSFFVLESKKRKRRKRIGYARDEVTEVYFEKGSAYLSYIFCSPEELILEKEVKK